jgi:dTDP-4-dehydrorhamnose 3,5-epimerase
MLFTETKLNGAFIIEPQKSHDERGFFARSLDINEFKDKGLDSQFVQSSISYNKKKGTIRGMHYQIKSFQEAKLVRCTKGSAFEVFLDLRPTSKTFMTWTSVKLTANNYKMAYAPKGFALGFQTLEDETELIYQMSQFYTPKFERGIKWDDPSFNIDWPLKMTVISKRDLSFPKFEITSNKKDYFNLE